MLVNYIDGRRGLEYVALFKKDQGGEELIKVTSGLEHNLLEAFLQPSDGYEFVGLCRGRAVVLPGILDGSCSIINNSSCWSWRIKELDVAGIPENTSLRTRIIQAILDDSAYTKLFVMNIFIF